MWQVLNGKQRKLKVMVSRLTSLELMWTGIAAADVSNAVATSLFYNLVVYNKRINSGRTQRN